jgi:uncharacterized membrane protein
LVSALHFELLALYILAKIVVFIFFNLLDQGTHEDQDTREKHIARERYRHAMSGDKKDEILAKKHK